MPPPGEGGEELGHARVGPSALEAAPRVVGGGLGPRRLDILVVLQLLGEGPRDQVSEAVADHELVELELVLGKAPRARRG